MWGNRDFSFVMLYFEMRYVSEYISLFGEGDVAITYRCSNVSTCNKNYKKS